MTRSQVLFHRSFSGTPLNLICYERTESVFCSSFAFPVALSYVASVGETASLVFPSSEVCSIIVPNRVNRPSEPREGVKYVTLICFLLGKFLSATLAVVFSFSPRGQT